MPGGRGHDWVKRQIIHRAADDGSSSHHTDALARLEREIVARSPLITASVNTPSSSTDGWRVRIHLCGLGSMLVFAPAFATKLEALAFREAANEALDCAT
jgi:hypothetical protein